MRIFVTIFILSILWGGVVYATNNNPEIKKGGFIPSFFYFSSADKVARGHFALALGDNGAHKKRTLAAGNREASLARAVCRDDLTRGSDAAHGACLAYL